MIRRLLINDLKENKLASASTLIFMTVTAMLLSLSVFLFGNLSFAIDSLMEKAKTPDLLIMHSGEIDEEELKRFSRSEESVDKMQICLFLNLENSSISVGNTSFEGNMQDNGLCTQNASFDFLLDNENNVIEPKRNEVYVPVCYRKEYGIKTGDEMKIGTESLRVAGFLRDSQMNSMMASSKRFLVSEEDYERLKPRGSEEYIIEFKTKKGSDINALATAYKDAALPGNGPAVTYPLIKMMNALSDGIMILVILIVSAVVLMISIMCIRYIIMTQTEKDRSGIGLMKAVGIPGKDIRHTFMYKYLLLSALGCILGIILALILSAPLGEHFKELYGEGENALTVHTFMILGALLSEGIILMSVRRTLKGTEKVSALSVLSGRGGAGRNRDRWIPSTVITIAAVFMILIPRNLSSTLSAPEFITYMGIGNSEIRVDVRQGTDMEGTAELLSDEIKSDDRVDRFSCLMTGSYKAELPDGSLYNLMIENGDHGIFPVKYTEGRGPERDDEIALSILNADEMGVRVGDIVTVYKDMGEGKNRECPLKVCGIYSDITNGGKTAKACIRDKDDRTDLTWAVLYVTLKDKGAIDHWIDEYRSAHSSSNDGVRIIKIKDYLNGIYGQTIEGIRNASIVTLFLGNLIIMVVELLIVRLVIWRERNDISLMKALGSTSLEAGRDYLKKVLYHILPGIIAGVFFGVVPGQKMAGLLLGFLGARGFKFVIDPLTVFISVPALTLVSALTAAAIGLLEIRRIRAYECLNAGED